MPRGRAKDRDGVFTRKDRPGQFYGSWVDASGRRYELRPQAPTTLGRAVDNDIVVADASVSRRHATIVPQNGGFALRDLASQNGTFVRGQRIDGSRQLASGDEVRLGDAPFVFHG